MPLPVAAFAPVAIGAARKVGNFIGGLFKKKKKGGSPAPSAPPPAAILPQNFLPGVQGSVSASTGSKSNKTLYIILSAVAGLLLIFGLIFGLGRRRRR